MPQAIAMNQAHLKEIGTFLSGKGAILKTELFEQVREEEKEIDEYNLMKEELRKAKGIQEQIVASNLKMEQASNIMLEQKRLELSSLQKEVERDQKELKDLQIKVWDEQEKNSRYFEDNVKAELVKELHGRCASDKKDPTESGLVNACLSFLKGAPDIKCMEDYIQFVNLIWSFKGDEVPKEKHKESAKIVQKFLNDNDTSLEKNKDASIPKNLSSIVPLAKWLKSACDIVDRQNAIEAKKSQISEKRSKKAMISGEVEANLMKIQDARERSAELEEEIKGIEEIIMDVLNINISKID
jgi:hypothetical protein